jgi:hypothetical protein
MRITFADWRSNNVGKPFIDDPTLGRHFGTDFVFSIVERQSHFEIHSPSAVGVWGHIS